MAAPTIAERVAAGAAWLDQHQPGWAEKINLERLDLSDGCDCICGQLCGDYDAALHYWFDDIEDPALDLGFNTYAEADWEAHLKELPLVAAGRCSACVEHDALTAEWRRLITARRVPAEATT